MDKQMIGKFTLLAAIEANGKVEVHVYRHDLGVDTAPTRQNVWEYAIGLNVKYMTRIRLAPVLDDEFIDNYPLEVYHANKS